MNLQFGPRRPCAFFAAAIFCLLARAILLIKLQSYHDRKVLIDSFLQRTGQLRCQTVACGKPRICFLQGGTSILAHDKSIGWVQVSFLGGAKTGLRLSYRGSPTNRIQQVLYLRSRGFEKASARAQVSGPFHRGPQQGERPTPGLPLRAAPGQLCRGCAFVHVEGVVFSFLVLAVERHGHLDPCRDPILDPILTKDLKGSN